MARRGENIRKRKDGRWEGRYRNGVSINGAPKYCSVYGKSYVETKNKLLQIKQDMFFGEHNSHSKNTFGNVVMRWLDGNLIKIKESTESKYRYMIEKHILPQLGNVYISAVTVPMINDFLYKKITSGRLDGKGGLSPSYVKTMAIIIESAMKFAYSEGLCAPLRSRIYKPISAGKGVEILDITTQQRFERLAASNINETIGGIYIALYAGLRIGELCALSWDDIDLELNIIHVRHTVTRRSRASDDVSRRSLVIGAPKTATSVRDIPISDTLLPILKSMRERSSSRYVISTHKDFVSTRTFDYRYKKVLRDFGLPEINFHAFRHTFATRCIEVGVDVKSLSQMLGHSSVAITLNTYVHPSIENMRTQIQKLNLVSGT